MKSLHIFKPGKHTDVNGKVIEFTEADLKASAAAYDPAKHEAPLVVGHPKNDDPAYGWARSLTYGEGALIAVPDQVDAAFAELVNAGRYKKISASFYLPDAPANPVPGSYYLRHIGFLGAQPPAVKGLKSASFAEAEEGVIEFAEPAEWRMRSLGSVLRNLRDLVISKFSIEEADRAIPSYLIDSIESAPEANTLGAAYSETSTENIDMQTKEQQDAAAKIKADQEALARQQAEFAEREARLKADEDKARRAEIASFCDALVEAGRLLPRDRDGLIAFMAGANESGVIEFGEGDAKKSVEPATWLRDFLKTLPVQVDFTERSRGSKTDTGTVSFAAPAGYTVDTAGLELHNKVLAYQAAHPGTDYNTALSAVK